MTPKPARLAVLALDVQHFSLQGQREGDVGYIIEPQPRDRMLQRGDRHGRPFGGRRSNDQHILGQPWIGLNDVRQEMRVAGIFGADAHNLDRNGRESRNHQSMARDVLLDQAAYGLEVLECSLRWSQWLQHSLSNGWRNNDLRCQRRVLLHIFSGKMRKLEGT